MRNFTLVLCGLLCTTAAVDVTLYKLSDCARTTGQDETCANQPEKTCCSTDELGYIEHFMSCKVTGRTIIGFANQGETRCDANLGSSSGCFNEEEGTIAGAVWRQASRKAALLARMVVRSTQDSETTQNTTEEQDGMRRRELYAARGLPVDHPDYCIGSRPTTHINGYFNRKIYLVKKADFDKAAFTALQSQEERLQYFEERVDIIRDNPQYAS